jgi:hypothetical protein
MGDSSRPLVEFKKMAEWLSRRDKMDTDVTFWNLCAKINPDSLGVVLKEWGIEDDPFPEFVDNKKRKRVDESLDSGSDGDELSDSGSDDDCIVEEPENDDEIEAGSGDDEIQPDCVGKYYTVDIEGEEVSCFRLIAFDCFGGEHTIEWLYTIEQLPDHVDTKSLSAQIERVKSIKGVALLRSSHQQTLKSDSWTDVSDQMFEGLVPESSILPIKYYIIDRFDINTYELSGNTEYADKIIDQLLSMGKDGGKKLKTADIKISRKMVSENGRCYGCDLRRTLSEEIKIDKVWRKFGWMCARKVKLAVRLKHAKSDKTRHKLILEATDVNSTYFNNDDD